MDTHQNFGALGDIRVIDLTQMLAGPFGTMMLADHGAEVIKVESPQGDLARQGGPFRADDTDRVLGGYFQSINRNKKSVVLDLKTEPGRRALLALVGTADAVVENFRPGVMDRLGLGYDVLREANPKLVYGSLSGFGNWRAGASPYAEWPAFDVTAQAMGGLIAITGPDSNTPTKVGPGLGDIIPGMMLAFGVLSAVHEARRSGLGQLVDVSMADAILAVCERVIWQNSIQGLVPVPEGNHHPFLCPFGIFRVRDGFVSIAAQQDDFFKALCNQLGASFLLEDQRFADVEQRSLNRLELISELDGLFGSFSKAELAGLLGGNIPFGPVLNVAEAIDDAHFKAREMIVEVEQPGTSGGVRIAGVPIKLTRTPGQVRRRGPLLGEHSAHYLELAGLSAEEIAECLAG